MRNPSSTSSDDAHGWEQPKLHYKPASVISSGSLGGGGEAEGRGHEEVQSKTAKYLFSRQMTLPAGTANKVKVRIKYLDVTSILTPSLQRSSSPQPSGSQGDGKRVRWKHIIINRRLHICFCVVVWMLTFTNITVKTYHHKQTTIGLLPCRRVSVNFHKHHCENTPLPTDCYTSSSVS